ASFPRTSSAPPACRPTWCACPSASRAWRTSSGISTRRWPRPRAEGNMVRVLLLLLVAVLLAYALWQLLHALRNRRRGARPPAAAVEATDEEAEVEEAEDGDEVDESAFNYAPVPRPDAPVAATAVTASEGEQERFQQELELQQLRRDIA